MLIHTHGASAQDTDFEQCLSELQDRARNEKLSVHVIDEVLANLKPQPRVIELDRSQPEFTQTFANYLYQRVTPERIAQGKRILKQYDSFLSRLTREHGVPGRYLVAFWGMETNFGSYLGRMPTLDSLATLACDQRRSAFFTDELMQALALLERESLSPADMRGSWAGAMGHTQFMPSAYRLHAIDGDGDGKVDLWRSERDALASGANYLADLGWQKGQRWGREILLPEGFPYAETGLANQHPVSYWKKLGIRFANGQAVPDIGLQASVLVPAGHRGPAFLVYPNFHVILEWNRSEFYALAVGLLADRMIGAGPLAHPPSINETALSRVAIEEMQFKLNKLGFDAGEIDGVMGTMTQSALRDFQASKGIIADGYPDPATLCALSINSGPESCL
jgi:membrane-bound lytic murein transglycosylase B